MTSAAITEFGVNTMNVSKTTKQGAQDGLMENMPNFSDFMSKETNVMEMPVAKTNGVDKTDAQSAYEKSEKSNIETVSKDVKNTKSSDTEKVDGKELQKAASKVEDSVKEAIAKELNVSVEDVEEALEVLGLTAMDVMSQGNMTQLIAQVTQVQPVEILTDGELFVQMEDLVTEVTDILSQVAEEIGMDMTEFTDAVKEAFDKASGTEEAEVTAQMPQFVNDEVTEKEENSFSKDSVVKDDAMNAGVSYQIDQVKEDMSDASFADQQTGEDKPQNKKEAMNDHELVQMNHVSNMPEDAFLAEAVDNLADASSEMQMPSTQEIIDQIAEYVKVHRSEQITEMEIALNPASLGNIHLQVASKAGTVSAQLIAQDQAVAAALEGQLLQLKESLEMQGLKVDAIEVTVSSHAFEQNLDQQGKQQEDEAARASAKKGGRKILDLNAIDEENGEMLEEMSAADRLQMEMMRMGGNRLNFQV